MIRDIVTTTIGVFLGLTAYYMTQDALVLLPAMLRLLR